MIVCRFLFFFFFFINFFFFSFFLISFLSFFFDRPGSRGSSPAKLDYPSAASSRPYHSGWERSDRASPPMADQTHFLDRDNRTQPCSPRRAQALGSSPDLERQIG